MSDIWKFAIVGALFFVLGSITVVSADKIKRFIITDGVSDVGVTEDGRLKVDAGELAVTLPEVQQVAVNNLPSVQNVRVRNFPDVQPVSVVDSLRPESVVNIIANELAGVNIPLQGTPPCVAESTFVVPADKTLLLTDIYARPSTSAALGTDVRGIIFQIYADTGDRKNIHLNTPLLVNGGETICPFRMAGSTSVEFGFFFASGRLVDAP